MRTKEAIILAGGMGTRLRSVISEIPKPMAPLGDRPFLSQLLGRLADRGIRHVVLAVGYKHEVIEDYYGSTYGDMALTYSIEQEPLGTGGAIAQASTRIQGKVFFLLNGDTLFDIDYHTLEQSYYRDDVDMSIALKPMQDQDRYGTVVLDEGRIIDFTEKRYVADGLINGGIYIMGTSLFANSNLGQRFSLEQDLLMPKTASLYMHGCVQDRYFIDIGIPSDYAQAQVDLI